MDLWLLWLSWLCLWLLQDRERRVILVEARADVRAGPVGCVIEKKLEGEEEVDRAREDVVADRKERRLEAPRTALFLINIHPIHFILLGSVGVFV